MFRSLWRLNPDTNTWELLTRTASTFATIKGTATSTTITVTPTSTTVAGSTIQVAVATKSGTANVASGTVSLTASAGGVAYTSGSLAAGTLKYTYTPSTTTSGTARLTATYTGDATYSASSSYKDIVVSKVNSSITSITAEPPTVTEGNPVTLTVATEATQGKVGFEYSTDAGATWKDWGTGADITLPTRTKTWTSNTPTTGWRWRAKHRGDTKYNASAACTPDSVTVLSAAPVTTNATLAWSQSWKSANNAAAKRGATPLYKGYYDSTNGDQRAAIGFTYSVPSGKTVTKVELYLFADHWFNGSGGTLSIGTHTSANEPDACPTASTAVATATWTKADYGQWVSLPTSGWDGTNKGIVLRPSGGTSQSSYGYFFGRGSADPPQLRITYK